MQGFILVCSLLGFFVSSRAQFVQTGQCDQNIQLQTNFNLTTFLGTWYEIARSPISNMTTECSSIELTPTNNTITFSTSGVNKKFLEEATGVATQDDEGRFTVTLDGRTNDFWILSTDYTTHAVAYRCENISTTQRSVYIWQLGRTSAAPTTQTQTTVNTILQNLLSINVDELTSIQHTGDACVTLPVIERNEPVILPGQCDTSISVVQNFDVARFGGLWHEISSYYSDNVQGTCSRAEYSLNGTAVDVLNSQVINQVLFTIAGNATVASTDGSAVLNVTLNVLPGVTAEQKLYIIATDYINYAISYSCENVSNDTKRVFSWIAGRSPYLTAAAQQQVDEVVDSIVDLNYAYYQETFRTPDDCFYYPNPDSTSSVVFRGTCDESIAAVPNFDPVRYMGLWHDIESYPSQFQGGSCNNANYTLRDGVVDVYNTQVINQTLDTINGVAIIDPQANGTGKLLVTFPIAGTNLITTTNYWILSTDYDTHSLVYSCTNIDEDSRIVFGWKLSRTKELPAEASNAIDNAMANIPVLDQRYFVTKDQSADGCFYYPDPDFSTPVTFRGTCDESIEAMPNFNPVRYMGLWHDIESYPSSFQSGSCNNANYTLRDGVVDVYNTQVINQTLDTINGVAIIDPQANGTGKLIVTFPVAGTNTTISTNYWILATDYDTFSLVYSCSNIDEDSKVVFGWKLSRTKNLPSAASSAIDNAMSNIQVLDQRYFVTKDQSEEGCFYYPDPDSSTPVTFRGTCNESIEAMPNFNPVRYMGLWHDIESYPSSFQSGSCNNANYTLRDGVVDVYNTQVINQTLDTINGVAIIDPQANGTGKLIVTFPVAGTNTTISTNYWILATDYDTFSLVYSCSNIDENNKVVFGWKLSRTKNLPSAASSAIDNAMSNIQVLDQRYFVTKDQSEEGCFYYPDPDFSTPVIFRGTCDESIEAMPNFNPVRYMGLWHDIESYPSSFQSGSCNNANYTLSDGVVDVYNTQVINQTLDTINGVAIIDPQANGTGKLIVTFPVAGTNITTSTNYWILSTDYDTYSLVYSCANIDEVSRIVFGWKLSRTKELPAPASNAIDNAMANIPVLDQRYFVTKDQSDAGCFYYPDLSLNEPVIFPGICEENIQVVNNFSPARFAGRWIDVESYYNENTGSCIETTFTNIVSNFEITTNQVINQQQLSQQRTATIASDGSGRFTVTDNGGNLTYHILTTDYSSYALVYSCENLGNSTRRVRAHKLSRERQLQTWQENAINSVMSNLDVLDDRFFNVRNQSESACFFYPAPVTGQPVTFRGQCDPNVQAVQSFDVQRYLGLWYDIEHYPQEFQRGTCATAQYSLGNNVVDVYNTEVVNQQLSTINGTAVVASTDGSAKLTVTFPIFGVPGLTIESPYWVLATDYDSYALVYSCNNLDEENHRVTVWKLSRTQNLAQNAVTAINNVMNEVPVIRQQYFEETGHTEDDCFYYPDNFGEPIDFDGQCPNANEVDVVTNFEAASFSGIWHEIARYPSELQTGECGSTTLTASTTNSLIITVANVVEEQLSQINGTGTVSGDGRGVITAVLTNPDTNASTTLPLYVLATEYNDYALVYSCRNLNATKRRVYSWKLSRNSTGLSQAANNAIDAQVSNITDLYEGYYEAVDQSDDACFYYPAYSPLPEAIELPGSCPNSIRGVSNFSAAEYLGRWYEIESYPQFFQNGECARAEYSLGDNGVVVYNTQVINKTLDIMIGLAEVASDDGSGLLNVTFVVGGVTNVANYYILATDYIDYALVYSCRNLTNGNRQVTSWKLSRRRSLSAEAATVMNNVIQNTQGLRQEYYTNTSQTDEDCFYIPELVENEPAEFRGSCDPNVPRMQNFSLERYLGWWHEIERYPSSNSADCTSSQFGATGSSYQVVDVGVSGGLGTYSTVPVVAYNDGRLSRTYPDGSVVDTWVLDTDYETYSLLYSCENIIKNDEQYRRVWSAKHSKARSLTAAAQNSMASIIADIPELVQAFYLSVDQSNEACFHYPEQTGQQIILPGQCDENIPVVTDFQVPNYSGTWYQIERYPQIHESGECTGARYTLDDSAGIVNVLNWEVVNGTLETIEGTAVPTYDDGTARLTVTLPVRGTNETVTTSLYVLTTDYVSYSLAYSCVNVNEYQRAIGAWKLSRERTMPAAGVAAIDSYMATRQELRQTYFLEVSHNEDCPEPSGGFIAKSSVIVVLACALLQLLH